MLLRATALCIALIGLSFTSCVTPSRLPSVELDFFAPPSTTNPWAQKIENWQARHRHDPARSGELVPVASDLAGEYDRFVYEMRQKVAAETVAWVQANSRRYYRPDGDYDHWATLGEVVESGGDDCDGLDLLTFVLLRKLGFGANEMYRSIVVEEGTGQHHMVTLWFDGGRSGREGDPFVLDPTGVVASGMARLSSVPSWEPIELFDETEHYVVRPRAVIAASAD